MVSPLLVVFGGVLLAAPGEPTVPPVEAPSSEPVHFGVGLLSSPGLDSNALLDALHLRLPELELRTQWSSGEGEGRVFISVRPTPDGVAVRTEVIAEDGRGYSRRLEVSPDDERRIASVLANLLFSIEEEAVAADVEDGVVPQTSAPEDVERAVASVESSPEPEPEAEPEPEPKPELTPEPEPTPAVESRPPEEPPASPEASPSWRAGVVLGGGVLLPLGGPRFGPLLQGGGLALGADAEHVRGARLGVRLRYVARDLAPFRLSRLRIAVGGGYAWTFGMLELPLRGELSIEPWWVVHEGERLSATRLGAPPSGTIALGAAARFSPAIALPVDARSLLAIRFGLDLGLGGSFVVDDGARVATVVSGLDDVEQDELFRIGGVEAWLGARIGLVFGRRPPLR